MQSYLKTVILLAFSSFCMGSTEFIVSGILTPLSLHFNISATDAGYMATVYAIGIVIGSPLSVFISKFDYKKQLICVLLAFCIANFIVYLSSHFYLALIARFISGLMHGLYFVIATIVAIRISPESKTSQTISIMMSGLTLALVSGVPLGIYLSSHYGLLSPFLFVSIVSLIVIFLIFIIMPFVEGKVGSLKNLIIAFKFPTLYHGFLITAFTCGAQFVLYIYLRLFFAKRGFDISEIGSLFLLYGAAAVVGNLFGGKLADLKGSFFALKIVLIGQVIFFVSMSFTFYINNIAMIINLFMMSFFGFASISPLKMLSAHLARKYTPNTQGDTIALNEGSFNVGIALASFVGGITAIISIDINGIFCGIFSIIALAILLFLVRSKF